MTTQQLILSLVLATLVFSVALELKVDDFRRVAQAPKAVICGLIPQFILLPVGTWIATLRLDLPSNVQAAMIRVATCPPAASAFCKRRRVMWAPGSTVWRCSARARSRPSGLAGWCAWGRRFTENYE
jgi:predicted permease